MPAASAVWRLGVLLLTVTLAAVLGAMTATEKDTAPAAEPSVEPSTAPPPDPELADSLCRPGMEWKHEELNQAWAEADGDEAVRHLLLMSTVFPAKRCSMTADYARQNLEPLLTEHLTHRADTTGDENVDLNWLPQFYSEQLDAAGLFAAWSTIASYPGGFDDRDEGFDATRQRLQEVLGLTLADATAPVREERLGAAYRDDLRAIGPMQLQLRYYEGARAPSFTWDEEWNLVDAGPVVHGWAVLAPLLRFGEFDASFLAPIAADVIQFDQEHEGDWAVEGEGYVSFDMFAPDAENAVEPVIEALSRNLTAASMVYDLTEDERVGALLPANTP